MGSRTWGSGMSYTDRLHERIADWMPLTAYVDVTYDRVAIEVPSTSVVEALKAVRKFLPVWLYGKPKIHRYKDEHRTVRFTWQWPMWHQRRERVRRIQDAALQLKLKEVTNGA